MQLQDWDKQIAPYLHRIEANAHSIVFRARDITDAMRGLTQKPAWLTRAEHQLGAARLALRLALAEVDAALDLYSKIPDEDGP